MVLYRILVVLLSRGEAAPSDVQSVVRYRLEGAQPGFGAVPGEEDDLHGLGGVQGLVEAE